ncbi:hypothetical protein O159_02020 [Leifsonia xyli subsp. cynodontis DSM 46306]|jgi:putative ABC transport system permease protein|uniref:ABC transporter permease n=1 Tax=Leifsonia xyli subsp. cynodontis DSM 46306 TaxID=1389489 RepID=U3P3Y7_LEIXC|nr:ABC transporter permease [Leifsonia xyli]AGW40446.1 hypothetical protein O159_02020 [Leifsonia xyli subsp. cynodontis DSM 46306]
MSAAETTSLPASRLLPGDVLRLGTAGLRARPVRAVLSALGIAIGIAAMVAVVGLSASAQAKVGQQLTALGTNLLSVQPGESFFGEKSKLPRESAGKVGMIPGVEAVGGVSTLSGDTYRSRLISPGEGVGVAPTAADIGLLKVLRGTVRSGAWLNEATGAFPAVVLGSTAAERLGVVTPGAQIWMGGRTFTVVGILNPLPLAPELDTAALIGKRVAADVFGYRGNPTTVYERSSDASISAVRSVLGRTVSPQAPNEIKVSRPSDALHAKSAVDAAFTGLLVSLGAVALLVGGIGVANTMIISVLERRREIGPRRALGATHSHIRSQFLAEALLLSLLGGVAGTALGAAVIAAMSGVNGTPFVLPAEAVGVAIGATLVIGALAGLYPAIRAARTPPTAALSS